MAPTSTTTTRKSALPRGQQSPKYLPHICDVGRENVPLVAESEAEKITIIHQAVIY